MAYLGFRHHLGLKVVSIALAAFLWVAVSGEQTVERSLRIPLEFTNLPSQLEVVGDAANVVDVRVRGVASVIERKHALAGANRLTLLDIDPANRASDLRSDLDHIQGRYETTGCIHLGNVSHFGDAASNRNGLFGAGICLRNTSADLPPVGERHRDSQNRDGHQKTELYSQMSPLGCTATRRA